VHSKASLALAAAIMLVCGYGVVTAWDWPSKAALFPLAIGIPLFCLAAVEAVWALLGSRQESAKAMDFQLSVNEKSLRRTAVAIAWMLGFFAAIVLLGFPIAVPLFVLLYLKLQGGEGWVLSIVMTLAVWGIFYGLFDRLLHLPFAAGWLFSAL
jgi:Tripartite tricarboxylate transporter TctB family